MKALTDGQTEMKVEIVIRGEYLSLFPSGKKGKVLKIWQFGEGF